MILAIISAIFCFAAAIFMFTSYFRKTNLMRVLSVFLAFEGVWILVSYLLLQLNPNNAFIFPINYIVTIVFMGYILFLLARTRFTNHFTKRKPKTEKKDDFKA